MSKKRVYWLCQLLGWSGMVTIEIVNFTFFIVGKFSQTNFLYFCLSALTGLLCTHLFKKVIIRFHLFQKKSVTIWLLAFLSTFLISFLIAFTDTLVFSFFGKIDLKQSLTVINVLGYIINWMRYTGVWVIIYFMYKILEQNNLLREEKLLIENDAKSAELELLKSQLNPHFLFNALNSIMALISIDPEKSRNAVFLLSDLLRFTLNYGKNREIELEAELNETMKYLELEKIRFGDKLQITYEADAEILNAAIPPALVLTLAENAIKHGRASENGIIKINLSVSRKADQIEIVVANSGSMGAENTTRSGLGLPLVKKRLDALYGDAAVFFIDEENGMVAATIKIPLDEV